MKFKALLTSIIFGALTACGGGGDDGAVTGLQGDLSQLASQFIIVEDIKCKPQLPSWNQFNTDAYNNSIQPPLARTYVRLSENQGDGGSTIVEIPIIDQNERMLSLMDDLMMTSKDFGSQDMGQRVYQGDYPFESLGTQPGMVYVPNKESYQRIRSHCRTVECVAESVFGESWGARFYFKDKYGLSVTGQIRPSSEEYADSEAVKSVLYAISSLPDDTFPISADRFSYDYQVFADNIVITPYATGSTMPGGEGAAAVMSSFRTGDGQIINADIMMFDGWKSYGTYDKAFVVFHELIHLLDTAVEARTTLSQTKEWMSLSEWLHDDMSNQWYADNKTMCSVYGRTNPTEDFAECGVLYRYAPDVLKQISMKKYNFYKNRVFKGIEYTSDSRCAASQIKFFN